MGINTKQEAGIFMKNTHITSFVHYLHMGLVSALMVLLFAACGHSPDSALQDDTDLSDATDLFSAAPAPGMEAAQDMERVLARVDGTEVTQGELMDEYRILVARLQGRVPPERLAQMQDEMLQGAMDNLIIKKLLLDQVDKQDIEVSDDEIDEIIVSYRQQLPPGTALEQQLASINMSEEEFRRNVARDIRVNKLLEEMMGDSPEPTDEAIAAFHEQHKDDHFAMPERVEASHILVAIQPHATPEEREQAREKTETLRQQLLDGADFAEVAQSESECPSSARGGDLGVFVRGQMVPPFEQAAFSQEIGEIGEIVQTDFGYHIILVTERHEAGTQSLEDSKDQIAEFLLGQSREKVLRAYVEELREAADIEILQHP